MDALLLFITVTASLYSIAFIAFILFLFYTFTKLTRYEQDRAKVNIPAVGVVMLLLSLSWLISRVIAWFHS
jgi:hypothetical protein